MTSEQINTLKERARPFLNEYINYSLVDEKGKAQPVVKCQFTGFSPVICFGGALNGCDITAIITDPDKRTISVSLEGLINHFESLRG